MPDRGPAVEATGVDRPTTVDRLERAMREVIGALNAEPQLAVDYLTLWNHALRPSSPPDEPPHEHKCRHCHTVHAGGHVCNCGAQRADGASTWYTITRPVLPPDEPSDPEQGASSRALYGDAAWGASRSPAPPVTDEDVLSAIELYHQRYNGYGDHIADAFRRVLEDFASRQGEK